MATRPIFFPKKTGDLLVDTVFVEFEWNPGMATTQKQKSIAALHQAAVRLQLCSKPLEISTKSQVSLGVSLSAFNLKGKTPKKGRAFTVETVFQSAKVFDRGGPYRDLMYGTSKSAKTDPRIKESGRLVGFDLFGDHWDLEPKTAFYDWIYINALARNPKIAAGLADYDSFTDIEFNPKRSINCQAYSVALFRSLTMRNMVQEVLSDKTTYLKAIRARPVSNAHENTAAQGKLL